MVLTVFKVIIITIFASVIYSTVNNIADATTVKNRMDALALLMQDEISRNNGMPDAVVGMFNEQLQSIDERSSVAIRYRTNMTEDVEYNGKVYPALSNTGEYGDLMPLIIQYRMVPTFFTYRNNAKASERTEGFESSMNRIGYGYTLTFSVDVPALRNLK